MLPTRSTVFYFHLLLLLATVVSNSSFETTVIKIKVLKMIEEAEVVSNLA